MNSGFVMLLRPHQGSPEWRKTFDSDLNLQHLRRDVLRANLLKG